MPFVPLPGAILRDKTTGRVWHLDVGHEWTIGRAAEAAVRLSDQATARRHTRIRFDDVWSVDDLRTTNGTWVNGTRVHRLDLRDKDVISVGRVALAFELGAAPVRPSPPGAIDDVLAAVRAADDLDAAPALHAYALEMIAGRREHSTAARAIARLVEIADEALLASVRDSAIAAGLDSMEIGLRATAAIALGVLATGDGRARRALEMMKRDRALEVRHAATEALGLERDRRR